MQKRHKKAERLCIGGAEMEEETSEDSETCRLKMKLESEDNERFELNLKKRAMRFKAGADLTEKVNLVDVDWTEEQSDESESLTVSIKIVSSVCPVHFLDKIESKN